MGEIEIRGSGALPLIQKLITNDATNGVVNGRALYTAMCNEAGGIVDDLVVYRFAADRYMVVANAANIEKDFEWISVHNNTGAEIINRSDETTLVALQGQNSPKILQTLTGMDVTVIKPFRFVEGEVAGIPTVVSRTGYTGEIGFELYAAASCAETLWNTLYEATQSMGGKPVGLGARDTLRLEARLSLYGNDIDETTTPLEAGLRRFVSFDKGEFIGRDVLSKQQQEGIKRRLVGFQMIDRGIARSHYPVYCENEHIGTVTSGAPSPTLNCNIGLAYLQIERSKINTKIEIEIRGKRHAAKVVRTPFYKTT